MNKNEALRYKTLLLAKQRELAGGNGRADLRPAACEPHGDIIDVASSEIDSAVQVRLSQTDGKLLRAIEEALTRIRQERYGLCEECDQPISKARLEAVPWARYCRECKEQREVRT